MPDKSTNKPRLSDLMKQAKAKPNADLYKGNPDKRKYHVKYRTPRDRLIVSKGMEYTRPLATQPAMDAKHHEVLSEFVNNGFDMYKAYASVYGVSMKTAKSATKAQKMFASLTVRAKLREILLGRDGDALEEIPKEYFIEQLLYMVDNNILDYVADDGTYLRVSELKALPKWAQQQIKRLDVHNTTEVVAVKDENGTVVRNEEGHPHYVEVNQQRVSIELYDRMKALELLAKGMEWINRTANINMSFITPDVLMQANARIKQLRRDDIEGNAERVTEN